MAKFGWANGRCRQRVEGGFFVGSRQQRAQKNLKALRARPPEYRAQYPAIKGTARHPWLQPWGDQAALAKGSAMSGDLVAAATDGYERPKKRFVSDPTRPQVGAARNSQPGRQLCGWPVVLTRPANPHAARAQEHAVGQDTAKRDGAAEGRAAGGFSGAQQEGHGVCWGRGRSTLSARLQQVSCGGRLTCRCGGPPRRWWSTLGRPGARTATRCCPTSSASPKWCVAWRAGRALLPPARTAAKS